MRLNDSELDCLIVSNAGFLAQKRLARGLLLNYPEAVAIISSQVNSKLFSSFYLVIRFKFGFVKMLEFVRDGNTYEQVVENGKRMLGKDLVQNGIDKMLKEITIEANFKSSGLKTVIKMI